MVDEPLPVLATAKSKHAFDRLVHQTPGLFHMKIYVFPDGRVVDYCVGSQRFREDGVPGW